VQFVETRTGVVVWSVPVAEKRLALNGCWCPAGTRQLVAAFNDGTVIWRDLADGKEVRRLQLPLGPDMQPACSTLSPDGQRLLTGHVDSTVLLWDLADGKALGLKRLDYFPIGQPAFSPDGRYALALSARGSQYFWKLPEPEPPADPPSTQGR
jgi:WD40 repeat protein